MALKNFKPTSPGQRGLVLVDKTELWKGKPEKTLTRGITKKGGLICFTINEGIYSDYGFDKKIDDLKNQNFWSELEFYKSDYIASKDVNAWLGLFKIK